MPLWSSCRVNPEPPRSCRMVEKPPSASALLRGQEAAGTAACNSTSTPCLVNLRCGRFVLYVHYRQHFPPTCDFLSFFPSFLPSYLWVHSFPLVSRNGRQAGGQRCYGNSRVTTLRETHGFKQVNQASECVNTACAAHR